MVFRQKLLRVRRVRRSLGADFGPVEVPHGGAAGEERQEGQEGQEGQDPEVAAVRQRCISFRIGRAWLSVASWIVE
jgi:hypothetical protein